MRASESRLSAALVFCKGRETSRPSLSTWGTHWRVSVYRSSYTEEPLIVRTTSINARQSFGLDRLSGSHLLWKRELLFHGVPVEISFGRFDASEGRNDWPEAPGGLPPCGAIPAFRPGRSGSR